ncbi:host cell factor 2-like [Onthophagus taurus]|uniref:host cell factor 2-like n=1 Tax=Onthophagus taurus TaxID=166361 RepID=UPI0039BDA970
MWTSVAPCDVEGPAPSARSKHSATVVGDHVYLLGGRNGNLPLKDFWKYSLVTGKWQQLHPSGEKLPCLQEHSAVAYKDNIYVFGGEVGFSAGTETPLWCYDVKNNSWKKLRPRKGVNTPKGRRGHSALVHRGTMLIYGGYQDLKGSCGELWAYYFATESWHLVSRSKTKPTGEGYPPPRHKHSAVIHEDAMWIYGGMTDLQERGDLWRWDVTTGAWSTYRSKINPGPLHSHAACKLPTGMVIFGGEREGHATNDVWKFNFTTELWEKIHIHGMKPQPRAEAVAFIVSELLLKDHSVASLENKANRTRLRTCSSVDRGHRHSSYFPSNKVKPQEQTFVFNPSHSNYIDGSELNENARSSSKNSFLQEISKLSQINLTKINNKCSYTVLTGKHTDSTESLLKQTISPQVDYEEYELSTPTRGTMIKSKSAYVIKKKFSNDVCPEKENIPKKRVEFDNRTIKIPRDPISVPNFNVLTLPTPVLTPVEATKLVYLDNEENEDHYHYDDEFAIPYNNITQVKPNELKELKSTIKRGDSYNSHLAYADNPLYQHMVNSNSIKFANYAVPETFDESVSSTSDYYSLETVNRLSSASNYSMKTNNTLDDKSKRSTINSENSFGFSNPNYLGPDIKNNREKEKSQYSIKKLSEDDGSQHLSETEDVVELQEYYGGITKSTKVIYRSVSKNRLQKSFSAESRSLRLKGGKCRASSASRAERTKVKSEDLKSPVENTLNNDISVPFYVFIFGGKEHGQVTVFQRPISIWKLKML